MSVSSPKNCEKKSTVVYKGSTFGMTIGQKKKSKAQIPTNPLNPWFLSHGIPNFAPCPVTLPVSENEKISFSKQKLRSDSMTSEVYEPYVKRRRVEHNRGDVSPLQLPERVCQSPESQQPMRLHGASQTSSKCAAASTSFPSQLAPSAIAAARVISNKSHAAATLSAVLQEERGQAAALELRLVEALTGYHANSPDRKGGITVESIALSTDIYDNGASSASGIAEGSTGNNASTTEPTPAATILSTCNSDHESGS